VGKGTLRVTLAATATANNCGKAQGFPLTYRLLQVSDPSAMAGLTLKQVWDKEEKVLGSALLKKTEGFVDPGRESVLPVAREDGATAMIVVGNFCQTRGNSWFVVQPLSRGGSVKLTAEATGFRVTP
jgi:type VI secretion system VasD/TssJ family lipoprotein